MNYLYAYPTRLDFGPVPPGDIIFTERYDPGGPDEAFIYLSARELSYPDQTLIGAWHSDGRIASDGNGNPIPIDPLFEKLRPFGNGGDGEATDSLDYVHWQGHGQREIQAPETMVMGTLATYPADNQPIILTMGRRWDDTVGFEGWGWVATIEFPDPNRAPDVRAIGVYDAQWNYLYTTGAFVWTEVGQDGNGDPIHKWQTISPAGQATVDKEPIHYALLFGSNQEGKMVLENWMDEQRKFFWERGQTQPGGQWVDSGATVTGMAGTVTLVSDQSPFSVGMLTRIDGFESTVDSLWTDSGLILEPYAAHQTGEMIEIWQ